MSEKSKALKLVQKNHEASLKTMAKDIFRMAKMIQERMYSVQMMANQDLMKVKFEYGEGISGVGQSLDRRINDFILEKKLVEEIKYIRSLGKKGKKLKLKRG